MLAARLQSFEDMFTHGGAELAEQIARDSTTLGNLITRHLAEFDRTVKTYGGELVERLGERTPGSRQRDARLPRQLRHPRQHQGDRGHRQPRPAARPLPGSARQPHPDAQRRARLRVMDIAKTLAEGGKEVVAALDKRIADVTGVINARGAKLAESIGAKIDDIDKALGARAIEVANNLDTRIGRFEELLVGRAEARDQADRGPQPEPPPTRSTRAWSSSHTIKTNMPARPRTRSSSSPRPRSRRSTARVEQMTQHHQDQHRRSRTHDRQPGDRGLHRCSTTRLEQLNQAIKTNAGEAERSLAQLATSHHGLDPRRARTTPSAA